MVLDDDAGPSCTDDDRHPTNTARRDPPRRRPTEIASQRPAMHYEAPPTP